MLPASLLLLTPALVLSAAPADAATGAPAAAERLRQLDAELQRDHRQPRAIVPLAELRGLEEELPDLPAAAAVYARVAQDREAHPEVRAWARLALSELDRARGQLNRSQAELSRLGLVEEWLLAGPFPFEVEGRQGFDQAFPPEQAQEIDLRARMPGKVREVGWRPLPPEARRGGLADLGAALRPVKETVVYALATLESPADQPAVLRLGASGAVKLWVNGALALADRAHHPARLDQLAVRVGLRRGPNRILVKVCHQEGRLALALRATTPAGEPLRLRQRPAAEPPPVPAARAAAGAAQPVPSLVALLEGRAARARGRRAEGQARFDLAVALSEKRSAEERERRALEEARRAVQLLPESIPARLLAARLEPDGNRQREHIETALASAPRDPRALVALAAHHLQRGRPHPAVPLLEQAEPLFPSPTPRLLLADAWEAVGLGARAHLLREQVARQFPLLPGPALALARSARALDRADQAAGGFRKVLALRHDDGVARMGLVQLLLDRGDLDGALLLLDEAQRLDPADLELRLRRADLLAGAGRGEEAEAGYAAAARICPEEDEVLERRGRARLRAGQTAAAVADLQAALDLRPQNAGLKELLRVVQPERERFERPYLLDAAALAAAWARQPRSGAGARGGPDEDAVVLGDLQVTKVHPSGLASRFQQRVIQVLNGRGAEALRHHGYGYVPGSQELRIERARVVKPDGTVVETGQESDRSASEPWYRLWYDTRARTLALPALAAGDLLELWVRTDDVAGENLLSDAFGDVISLAERQRRLRWEYVLLMPPRREIHASELPPGVTRADRTLESGSEHRWSARDLPGLEGEPSMPGWSEAAPFLHVSTFASWRQVADFWWGLARDQLVPSAEVRETAEQIGRQTRAARRAAGLPVAGDERALVEAVHAFVVTNIRYVGLEFGIHGYKPYRVDEVLARRFGDCKDKASLTRALLGVLGIDARLVLLRTRSLGAMPESPASLSIFNHAIAWVPDLDLWLDGTASFHGTRDVPGEDRGASVLVVNPGAAPRFTRLPAGRAEDNLTDTRFKVRIAADGSATVEGDSRIRGQAAPGYRRAYQAEDDRRAVLEQALSRSFPGLSVRAVQLSDLTRLEEEVRLRFELGQPRYAERVPSGWSIAPFGAAPGYAEAYAPAAARQQDLVLGDPWESRFAYAIALPEGVAPADLPPPAQAETPFGAYHLAVRPEGGGLVAEGRIVLRSARVAAADYPAFRDFVVGLDRALARRVLLRARTAAAVGGARGVR